MPTRGERRVEDPRKPPRVGKVRGMETYEKYQLLYLGTKQQTMHHVVTCVLIMDVDHAAILMCDEPRSAAGL